VFVVRARIICKVVLAGILYAGHTIASADAEKLSGFLCIFQSPDGILTVDLNSSQQVYAEAEQEAIACGCNNERMCEFGIRAKKHWHLYCMYCKELVGG
jgi:hypothetical protein